MLVIIQFITSIVKTHLEPPKQAKPPWGPLGSFLFSSRHPSC